VLRTKSELCQYDINIKFCLALQLLGVGRQHGCIISSFLDLPESHKWPKQFSTLGKFLYPATEMVECESQEKASVEEAILTNIPDSTIEQSLIEDDNPRYQVEASYDMGWQVRSSGGKYGSSMGHGLLIGALSKKVLDSVVFHKKCAVCMKNKGNAKNIIALKTMTGLQNQWRHLHLPLC
jgi:hypothetical protein